VSSTPFLNFPERYRREEALAQFKTLQPSDCRTVGLGLAQFGHHVRVDQVADQSKHRRLARFDRAAFGERDFESRTFTQKYILPGQTVFVF